MDTVYYDDVILQDVTPIGLGIVSVNTKGAYHQTNTSDPF